jgi:hypothetical protein
LPVSCAAAPIRISAAAEHGQSPARAAASAGAFSTIFIAVSPLVIQYSNARRDGQKDNRVTAAPSYARAGKETLPSSVRPGTGVGRAGSRLRVGARDAVPPGPHPRVPRGGRRAPHKPLLLLYALARLKHDRQTEIRFNATETIVNPLLRSYGPWAAGRTSPTPTVV